MMQIGLFGEEEEEEEELASAGSDVAYTKEQACASIVRYLAARYPVVGAAWEPCAGGGAWLDHLPKLARVVVASELDPLAASILSGRAVQWSALQGPPPDSPPIGAMVTNPPFTMITQFLKVGLGIPSCHLIALLVRQGWLLPLGKNLERRREVCWGPEAKPVEQLLLSPRLNFSGPKRKKGCDNTEYGVLIWQRQPDGGWMHPNTIRLRCLNWKTGEIE